MTGYIIYYQQEEGGQRLSEIAEAAATTASMTGLIAGVNYSITMVVTSSTLPSTETAAQTVTIGTVYMTLLKRDAERRKNAHVYACTYFYLFF